MSIEAVSWALAQKTGNAERKLLLAVLAEHADAGGGSCHPSRKLLMDRTEIPASTLKRRLAELEELGLIRRVPRFRPNGSQMSNGYHLSVTPARSEPPPARRGPLGVQALSPRGVQAPGPLEPSVEPSVPPEPPVSTLRSETERGSIVENEGGVWEDYRGRIAQAVRERLWQDDEPPIRGHTLGQDLAIARRLVDRGFATPPEVLAGLMEYRGPPITMKLLHATRIGGFRELVGKSYRRPAPIGETLRHMIPSA